MAAPAGARSFWRAGAAFALLGAVLIVDGGWAWARPRRKHAPPIVAAEPAPPKSLRLTLSEGGQLIEIELAGARLRIKSTAGRRASERDLDAAEHAGIARVARAAVFAEGRTTCGAGEVYLTVTVDGATGSSALCPDSGPAFQAWRALLDTARALLPRR